MILWDKRTVAKESFMSMIEELESETDVRIPDFNKELVRRFGA